MSFLANLESWFETTEADVVALVVKIKSDIQVVETDISNALKWVASQVPNIVAGIQQVERAVMQLGVANNPDVAAGIAAANLAVQALNAFAAAENSGTTNTQAVVNGYVAVKQAQAAAASAAAAAAATPTKIPAPAAV